MFFDMSFQCYWTYSSMISDEYSLVLLCVNCALKHLIHAFCFKVFYRYRLNMPFIVMTCIKSITLLVSLEFNLLSVFTPQGKNL